MFDKPHKPEQTPRQNESRERIQQALRKADGFIEERRMDPHRQLFVRKLIADSLKRPST